MSMCQANPDTRQGDISKATGKLYHVPILYLTELIGLSTEHPLAKEWLFKHMVSCEPILDLRNII